MFDFCNGGLIDRRSLRAVLNKNTYLGSQIESNFNLQYSSVTKLISSRPHKQSVLNEQLFNKWQDRLLGPAQGLKKT